MLFQSIFAGAALVAAAVAQSIAINSYPEGGVVAGQTYEVTYSPADDTPTTFILRQGPSGNLNTIGTLTSSATGGKFSWTVSDDLTDEDNYALEIQRGSEINYSGQFGLTGGKEASPSAAPSASPSAAPSTTPSASHAASSAAASASAALSSAIASAVSSVQASASASPSLSGGLNSTIASATLSRSATGTGRPNATGSGSIPESTGAAASMAGSPLAAVFGAIAAFAYLA